MANPVVDGLAKVWVKRLTQGVSTSVAATLGSGFLWGVAMVPVSQWVHVPEAIAQTVPQERVISVRGQGAVAIPVTHAQIVVGIEVQGKSAAAAQSQLTDQSSTLVNWLQEQTLEDLETQSISLSPRYDRNSELIGYVARTTLTFRAELGDSGALIDGAVRNGATRINNVALTAAPTAIQQAHQDALALAAQSAQAEADVVLAALGLSRKEIIGIQVQGTPPPQFATRGAVMEAGAPPMPVVGGEQTVNAYVTLQIRY